MDDQDRFIDDTISEEDERMDFTSTREVHPDKSDPEVKSLYDKYKKGRLNIQPEFQRKSVWDTKKSSKLIESAILRIPLPTVYLSEDDNGRASVIDGQQRLTAFFDFMDGKFKLTGLEAHKALNGQVFSKLNDEFQEKISECVLRVISFRQDSDPNLKFEIFKRLNLGAVSLNDQEMRNCTFRGPYNELLIKLSENKDFRTRIMVLNKADNRMRDVGRVLRFAAFYFNTYLNYKSPIKEFMNLEMQKRQKISDIEAQELEKAFKNSVSCVLDVFGDNPFRRWSIDNNNQTKQEPKKFSDSLCDILMGEFAKRDRGMITNNSDSIREALIYLSVSDNKFIDSITRATSNTKNVIARFDIWRKTLDEILAHEQKQPRCFSYNLKKELFDKDPTCQICGQRIMSIDDAAVDHIEQYWLGGKTIPENARLTHRYCNNARPRKD